MGRLLVLGVGPDRECRARTPWRTATVRARRLDLAQARETLAGHIEKVGGGGCGLVGDLPELGTDGGRGVLRVLATKPD
ncbi:hypothetical protein ABIC27_005950 [Streptomyces sp. PvR034]